jgi:hypothetical protein
MASGGDALGSEDMELLRILMDSKEQRARCGGPHSYKLTPPFNAAHPLNTSKD